MSEAAADRLEDVNEPKGYGYPQFVIKLLVAFSVVLIGAVTFVIWISINQLTEQASSGQRASIDVHLTAEEHRLRDTIATALALDAPMSLRAAASDARVTPVILSRYVNEIQKFSYAFTLSPRDELILSTQDGAIIEPRLGEPLLVYARPVIEQLRRKEREDAAPGRQDPDNLQPAMSTQGYVRINSRPYLVTAVLIPTLSGAPGTQTSTHAVFVAFTQIDKSYFQSLRLSSGAEIALAASCRSAAPDLNCLERKSVNASPAFAVTWPKGVTNVSLVERTIFLMAVIIVILATLFAIFFVRTHQIQRRFRINRDRVAFLAFHDALTTLPNRALAFDRLGQMIATLRRQQKWVAVHALDLDLFKTVNDTYGHAAGDELLQAVAQRLLSLCRSTDTVCRLGGDEFLVIQVVEEPAQAARLADRLVAEMARPFLLNFGSVKIGCSIGTVTSDDVKAVPDDLVLQADAALYKAKADGGNTVTFFNEDLDHAITLRKAHENALRQAIAGSAITIAYQGMFDATGQCVALEALARWRAPDGSAISPNEFMRLAEESHQAIDLGRLILEKIAEDTQNLSDVRICINLSATQLHSIDFQDLLIEFIRNRFSKLCSFELEITEAALIADATKTRATLDKLRKAGYTISLDDFGTGYSSLTHVREFDFDRIKVDSYFISGVLDDRLARFMVAAIAQICHSIGVETVAEGVETEEVRTLLAGLNINLFQGYLFGQGVAGSDIGSFFGTKDLAPKAC